MIPKSHQANKWCLTVDLSFLKGRSINDSIPKHLCSLKYISINNAVQKILSQGRGAILAKIDVKSAFRLLPVHPSDRHLLGMSWNKALYVDNCLQFCLHSAPKLFNLLADLLAWVLEQVGLLQQNPQDYDNLMMWAACCIAFYGFLRCSEFTMPSQQEYDPQVHLQYEDAAVDCRNNPRMLMVGIKQSKMDLFRQGVTLCLGKTDCAICPLLDDKGTSSWSSVHHQQGSLYDKTIFSHSAVRTPCQAGLPQNNSTLTASESGQLISAKVAHISDVHIQAMGWW